MLTTIINKDKEGELTNAYTGNNHYSSNIGKIIITKLKAQKIYMLT